MLGEDIRLATFDNYDILDCLPVKIDSVEQDCELIAQTLFDYGQAMLKQPDMKAETTMLPAKIHYRR
ncbi:hypothetical protein ACODM8_13695 [Vibrio ostreicida]|uniref:hypothetical protein n=1 Tax=Vibrio ostreicida TaxID=526588 RepID=UPI003B5B267E